MPVIVPTPRSLHRSMRFERAGLFEL